MNCVIVVIGAGIVGASAAYHLAKAGADVTVIDRFDRGQATDAAAGIVCPWLSQRRNKAWYELVKGGARHYPQLIKQLKADGETETGYKQVGAISIHSDIEKLEKMAERARTRREDAPEIGEIQILSPEETKKLFPPIGEEYGSVYVSGGARVNGRALRDALIRASQKNGAKYINGDASLVMDEDASLVMDEDEIKGVKVNSMELEVEKVIITAGAWAKELFQSHRINFDVTPQKAQIVHLQIDDETTNDWPVVMPPNNQYMLTFKDGKVVIGATHEDDVGFDTRVTAGGLNEIFSKALQVAPGLSEATVVETRVGFRPFTPGFLPIIGEVPTIKGAFVVNGLGASGLTSGPYLGSEIAKLTIGEPLEIDISLYEVGNAFV